MNDALDWVLNDRSDNLNGREIMTMMKINLRNAAFLTILSVVISSCSYLPTPTSSETARDQQRKAEDQGSFITGKGESGIKLDELLNPTQNAGGALPINALLWRAALDTVSVMPLDSVDTFGGTIITEWYAHPEDPTKRIKIAIFILDQELRADAVKVQTYLQQRPEGMFEWQDIGRDDGLSGRLEDLILTRAREIRAASILESN